MNATSTMRRGAGRPTTEQAEARHGELLDAALDLFLEHGFELTTIEMIAARISMTKRTVYARYADKASLFRGAVQRAIERQIVPQHVLEGFDQGDLTETLASIARLRIGQVMTPNGLRLQRIINTESYRFPEIFTANFEQSAKPVIDFVAGLLDRAIAAGTDRSHRLRTCRLRLHEHGDQRPGARDRERPPANGGGNGQEDLFHRSPAARWPQAAPRRHGEDALIIGANQPVAVVTGASSGIGKSTASKLAALGWQVIGVGRDPQRCAAAEAEIAAAARDGGGFIMLRGDFTLMAEVNRVADEVAGRAPRLDVLINNAGGVRDRQVITAEGTEATFAANHLAPFLLTRELMPLLKASAASQPPGTTRVIAVSSSAHRVVDGLAVGRPAEPPRAPAHPRLLPGEARHDSLHPRTGAAGRHRTESPPRRCIPAWSPATSPRTGIRRCRHTWPRPTRSHPTSRPRRWPGLPPSQKAAATAGATSTGRRRKRPHAAAQDHAAAARLWAESEALLAKLGF